MQDSKRMFNISSPARKHFKAGKTAAHEGLETLSPAPEANSTGEK